MKDFLSHSGDFGDIIYGLSAVKAIGGVEKFYVFHKPGRTTHGMSRERFDFIKPLLESQPYINEVIYDEQNQSHDSDLNGFRDHAKKDRNLSDMHLATLGLDWTSRTEPWITIADTTKNNQLVIFARSERYNNNNFPWKKVGEKYPNAVFIGTDAEHQKIQKQIGRDINRTLCKDALEMAKLIYQSAIFIGNQSLPAAIAESIKHPCMVVETYSKQPNCQFHRVGRINAFDSKIELPDLPS